MPTTDFVPQDASPPARAQREPVVRTVTPGDIREAFLEGLGDFKAAPGYGLFFGGLYALGGIAIVASVFLLGLPYLAYPLAAGFALVGPFAAVGIYEVSRRREQGLALSWRSVLGTVFQQRRSELRWMAFVTLFALIVWLYQVRLLLAIFLGFQPMGSLGEFIRVVFTTPDGLLFLAVGHIVGAALAVALFSLTVISFPLLLDRPVDFITAMITSVRAVIANPRPMLAFAAAIVVILALASLPFFLGLPIALPILGHATWRLYRRVVAPN